MELREVIYQRRAIRDYAPRDIEPQTVRELLSDAVQAPSAMNQQPWSFAVFHGRERLSTYSRRAKAHLLASFPPGEHRDERAWLEQPDYDLFYNAPVLIVISTRPVAHTLVAAEDCCLAAENLMLAACDRGLGTCPIGFARAWLNRDDVKRELGIPPDHTPVFALILGHPAHTVPAVERQPPAIVSWMWT